MKKRPQKRGRTPSRKGSKGKKGKGKGKGKKGKGKGRRPGKKAYAARAALVAQHNGWCPPCQHNKDGKCHYGKDNCLYPHNQTGSMVPKAYLAKMLSGQDYVEDQCQICEGDLDWENEEYQESEWESDEDNFTDIDTEEEPLDQGDEDIGSEGAPAKCFVAHSAKRKHRQPQQYYDMGDLCWDDETQQWYDPYGDAYWDGDGWDDDDSQWDDWEDQEDEEEEEGWYTADDPEATEDEDDEDDWEKDGPWDNDPNNWPVPP